MTKGNKTQLRPFLVNFLRHGLVGLPLVDIRFEHVLADFATECSNTEVRFVVVGVEPLA